VQSGKTPERDEPCTRLWDETSLQAVERSKPSRGCDRLRTEHIEELGSLVSSGRSTVMSR
jgi:hypothetical protein